MAANMILAHKESTLAVTKANQDFTSKLYALLVSSAGKDSNMVVSPFSISAVMAMAFAGAKGSTAEQMKTVLAFPEKDQVLMEGYGDLSNILKSSDNFTLDAANRLFVQENFKLLESYTHRVRCHFQALPESVNFLQGEEARGTINCWVEKQTHEKIKDLIPVGALSVDTRLVLVNAIYFKGDWENKFNTEATSQDKFTTAKATEVTASMMHQEVKCRSNHSKELGCTVLEMPYKGKRLSMLIFLSHTPGGFDAMEEKFTALDMANLELMPEIKYAIALPKFKLETSHDLVSNLKAVGLVDMFVPGMADFSGITGSKDLHVSSVVQKAFIEVNEEGSEAAAATGMMMQVMCMPTPPKKFICNRPFLFAIKDNLSGMILFTGRVVDPTKGK
jgi:serpin B